jgi:hypothetical protein
MCTGVNKHIRLLDCARLTSGASLYSFVNILSGSFHSRRNVTFNKKWCLVIHVAAFSGQQPYQCFWGRLSVHHHINPLMMETKETTERWILSVSGVPWLKRTGSGLDDWIYWHFYYNYMQFQQLTISDCLRFAPFPTELRVSSLPLWLTWFWFTSQSLPQLPLSAA